MFIEYNQRGASLIELIMFIMIISIALTGIMLMTNQTSGNSANTLLRKQALAAAEALLEEIEARPFSGAVSAVTQANRSSFHIVSDYNNFASSGIFDLSGSAVTGLSDYNIAVSIAPHALGNVPSGSAVQITVTVAPPAGAAIDLAGYRTNY